MKRVYIIYLAKLSPEMKILAKLSWPNCPGLTIRAPATAIHTMHLVPTHNEHLIHVVHVRIQSKSAQVPLLNSLPKDIKIYTILYYLYTTGILVIKPITGITYYV